MAYMRQPVGGLSRRQVALAFAATSCLLVLVTMMTMGLSRTLRIATAPMGIVNLELAGTVERSLPILEGWHDADVLDLAAFLVGFDYLYIVLYTACLALGCVWATQSLFSQRLAAMGTGFAWLQLLAGVFDAIENVGLLAMIRGSADTLWPQLVRACAIPKFLIVASGFVFIATAHAIGRWEEAFPGRFGRSS